MFFSRKCGCIPILRLASFDDIADPVRNKQARKTVLFPEPHLSQIA
jgi:hypothetical protein